MTHDPDRNIFAQPEPSTDVFDWLSGEGFVMVDDKARRAKALDELGALDGKLLWPADPMPSVADEVKVLEGLLG